MSQFYYVHRKGGTSLNETKGKKLKRYNNFLFKMSHAILSSFISDIYSEADGTSPAEVRIFYYT